MNLFKGLEPDSSNIVIELSKTYELKQEINYLKTINSIDNDIGLLRQMADTVDNLIKIKGIISEHGVTSSIEALLKSEIIFNDISIESFGSKIKASALKIWGIIKKIFNKIFGFIANLFNGNKKQIEKLKQSLKAEAEVNNDLKETISDLNEDIEMQQEYIDKANNVISLGEQNAADLQSKLSISQTDTKELQATINKLRDNLEKQQKMNVATVSNLKLEIKTREDSIRLAEEANKKSSRINESLRISIKVWEERLQNAIDQSKKKLKKPSDKLDTNKETIKQQLSTISDGKNVMKRRTETITKLKKEINKLKAMTPVELGLYNTDIYFVGFEEAAEMLIAPARSSALPDFFTKILGIVEIAQSMQTNKNQDASIQTITQKYKEALDGLLIDLSLPFQLVSDQKDIDSLSIRSYSKMAVKYNALELRYRLKTMVNNNLPDINPVKYDAKSTLKMIDKVSKWDNTDIKSTLSKLLQYNAKMIPFIMKFIKAFYDIIGGMTQAKPPVTSIIIHDFFKKPNTIRMIKDL